jgi:outer membrane immunogenic protein
MRKHLLAFAALLSFFLPVSSRSAELGAPEPAPPPLLPYPWVGFYAGGVDGFGWGTTSGNSHDTAGIFTVQNSFDRSGFSGGLQAGYNWMASPNWVIGLEGDIAVANIKNSFADIGTPLGDSRTVSTLNAIGTVRGRVGYAWNNFLIYATGGAAFVEIDNTRTIITSSIGSGALNGAYAISNTGNVGWAAGGGVEWAFWPSLWPNLTAKLEFLFIDVNSGHNYFYSYTTGTAPNTVTTTVGYHSSFETQLDTVRGGFSYHFNDYPAPLK